jgi:protocatechuate 3,4-dioxygenase beta subunit
MKRLITLPRDPALVLPPITRRSALRIVGGTVAAAPLAGVLACGSDDAPENDAGGARDSGGGSDAGNLPGEDAGGRDAGTTSSDGGKTGWASGGTASMVGPYPDPFVEDPSSCELFCAMTLGPCYAGTLERQDVSEGYPGLPVRLALRVVDETCAPVPNAVVDIWHTRNSGLYSGPDAIDFCTTGDADARTHRYFRGTQTSGESGRVDFDTCYPGWYPGRTIHIHFQVRLGASEYVTSQLYFPQVLSDEIFASHVDYAGFGAADTTNATDSVLRGITPDPYLLEWARMPDGAMLAYKVLVIRSSLASPLCDA